jgi:hypothetical protein
MKRIICLLVSVTLATYALFNLNVNLLLTKLNQLDIEVERRIKWYDWESTQEETFCRSAYRSKLPKSLDPVPNVVHFILLAAEGNEAELSYAQFLAIKSAVLRMNASEVKLHTYGLDARNQWWPELSNHVTLVLLDRNETYAPYDHPIGQMYLAHQADIIRLSILLREGGIYLDTDVYALKPFDDLLNSPRDTLMGHEGGNRYGLCNAVIVSRPHSTFLHHWQQSYKSMDPRAWNYHSVRKPKLLQIQHSDLICPLAPTVFFWPTWAKSHVHYMHDTVNANDAANLRSSMSRYRGVMYDDQLAIHGWGAHEKLQKLTPVKMMAEDTRFNILLREVAAAELP